MSTFKLLGLLLLLAPKLVLAQSPQGPTPQVTPPLRSLPCALACTQRAMAGSQDIYAHCHANCPQEIATLLSQKLSGPEHPTHQKQQPAQLLVDFSGNIVPPGMLPPSENKKTSTPSSKKTDTDSEDDASNEDSESTNDSSNDSEDKSSDDDSESSDESTDDESEKDSSDDTSDDNENEDSNSDE